MSSAPLSWWEQLEAAIQQSKSRVGHTNAQLSTVRGPSSGRLHGRPAVRTVNIRGFTDRVLDFTSDLRSRKTDDVTTGASEFAELCWWFPECNKQFRISGRLRVRSGDDMSREAWQSLTSQERQWWMWPYPAEKRAPQSAFVTPPAVEEAPDNFCVCQLVADHVDVLDLGQMPFMREMHNVDEASSEWKTELVNP